MVLWVVALEVTEEVQVLKELKQITLAVVNVVNQVLRRKVTLKLEREKVPLVNRNYMQDVRLHNGI